MKPNQPLIFWTTLCVVVMSLITQALAPKGIDRIPHGFKSATVAIELPRSGDDIRNLVDAPPLSLSEAVRIQKSFRIQTYADFLFIVGYVGLWFLLARQVSLALSLVPVAAGVADVFENFGILRATRSAPTQAIANATRYPSLAKWFLLGVLFISLLYVFRPRRGRKAGWQAVYLVIGLCYAWAGVLCIVGVLVDNPIIEFSFPPLSVALTLQLVAYWFAPAST